MAKEVGIRRNDIMQSARKCIYLLEDDDDIRELISYLLTEENYEVHGYPTVKSFQKEMIAGRPDLIILDVMLTDGNGIDVCTALKKNQLTHNIPVLMMSAHAYFSDIQCLCNAEDFISKPFDINDFVKKIEQRLQA